MDLHPDFKEFIKLLNEYEVRYLVVGGYAVGAYGRPRYTGDIDFWIAISIENSAKVVQVLNDFGFGSIGLKQEEFLKEDIVIQLGYEPVRIDILTSLTGLKFNDCYSNLSEIIIDNIPIKFISLDDLKKNKSITGRKKDLGDVEELEK